MLAEKQEGRRANSDPDPFSIFSGSRANDISDSISQDHTPRGRFITSMKGRGGSCLTVSRFRCLLFRMKAPEQKTPSHR